MSDTDDFSNSFYAVNIYSKLKYCNKNKDSINSSIGVIDNEYEINCSHQKLDCSIFRLYNNCNYNVNTDNPIYKKGSVVDIVINIAI